MKKPVKAVVAPAHTAHSGGGHAAVHRTHRKKHPAAKAAAAKKKAAAAKTHKPRRWSPDSDLACCTARAVTETLRLAIGVPVSDDDVETLYWHTTQDPDAGATILDTLTAAHEYGVRGYIPAWHKATDADIGRSVLVVGLQLEHDTHAVAVDRYCRTWSWGEPLPADAGLPGDIEECWAVTWCAG